MTRFRLLSTALFGIGLTFSSLNPSAPGIKSAQADEKKSVRAEIGRPIQKAQELQKEKKFSQALAELRKTDSISGKSAYETYAVELTRGSIASQAGDEPTAVKAFTAVLDSGMAPPEQRVSLAKALAGNYYNDKNYPQAIVWANRYFKEGGTDPQIHQLVLQSYFVSNNFTETEKVAAQQVAAAEHAGQKPPAIALQMWANAAVSLKDNAGYQAALEKLVTYYPKVEFWSDLIHRVASKPGFADRLALDASRLEFYVGALTKTDELMDMIQLDLQEGKPGEAKTITDFGYQTRALGTGADTARQARLRSLVQNKVAEDQKDLPRGTIDATKAPTGDGLMNIGFSYVLYGQTAKGIDLMEQGMAKGGLKHPGESKLHLGIAYLKAGQKAKAIETFNSITDTDGSADLAHLWKIAANQPAAH